MIAKYAFSAVMIAWLKYGNCRDEEKIVKACYWPNELYESCFAGCAEVSCDNPRNHLRPCYPYCEPGCVCEEPYVRDDRTHQCVLPQDCSPTQMGIPVVSKRSATLLAPVPPLSAKYVDRRPPRPHSKRDEVPPEFPDPDIGFHQQQISAVAPPPINKVEDFKPEVSRMGNYFNIVIAPPPIKALQPRKMLNSGFSSMKRL